MFFYFQMSETFKEKKVCLKCGEVYRKKFYAWQIYRNSGIPYAKKEYSILICEDGIFFFFPPGQIKLNSQRYTYYINYHDKNAVNEVESNRCIMQGCDGELKPFTGDQYEILTPEKKEEYFYKYFGEDGTDVSEYDYKDLMLIFPNEFFVTSGDS